MYKDIYFIKKIIISIEKNLKMVFIKAEFFDI